MRHRASILLCLLLAPAVLAADQLPPSFGRPVQDARSVGAWVSPRIDVPALLAEDAVNAERFDVPLRVGFPMAVDLEPGKAGTVGRLRGRRPALAAEGREPRRPLDGGGLRRLPHAGRRAASGSTTPTAAPSSGPTAPPTCGDHGELWSVPIEGDTMRRRAVLAGEAARRASRGCTWERSPTATSPSDIGLGASDGECAAGRLGRMQHRRRLPAGGRLAGPAARRRHPAELGRIGLLHGLADQQHRQRLQALRPDRGALLPGREHRLRLQLPALRLRQREPARAHHPDGLRRNGARELRVQRLHAAGDERPASAVVRLLPERLEPRSRPLHQQLGDPPSRTETSRRSASTPTRP